MNLIVVCIIVVISVYCLIGILFFLYDWYHQRPGVMSSLLATEVLMYAITDIFFWPIGLKIVKESHEIGEDIWDIDRANKLLSDK